MYEIIGYRRASGTSKKTGKPYSGYFVHLTYTDPQVSGIATEQVFMADEVLIGRIPAIGDCLDLVYNKSGFLTKVDFK